MPKGSRGGSKAVSGGGKSNLSADYQKALNVLEGHRGVAAFDENGKLIGVTNETAANGALKLNDPRLKQADSLLFTTGRRDAKNAVVPSAKYSELFADSKAKIMTVVGTDITYTISKTTNFRSDGFKKFSSQAHTEASQSLRRKGDIIKKSVKSGKMTKEESLKVIKRANKEYTDSINSFYKEKKNQKRYGFTISHD